MEEGGACAAQGQHAADFPVAGDRLALVAALRRQTKDIVAWFRRAMAAIFIAGHFAERQRFCRGGSTRMVISLRVILSSMAWSRDQKNIIERKDQLEGALSPGYAYRAELKVQLLLSSARRINRTSGCSSLIRQVPFLLSSASEKRGRLHRGRWIMVTWEWPAGCPARYSACTWGHGINCASPRSSGCRSPRPRRDRRGWRTGG